MRPTNLASLFFCAALAIVATGCCGPLACGPLGYGHGCAGGCAGGCGECYIDPWINEPASCDPCDSCGNYNGQSCGACRPVFGCVASLWGYRYDAGCCDGHGCSSCDSGCDAGGDCGCGSHGGHEVYGGPMEYHGPIVTGQPTPLGGSIVEGEVIQEPYAPARSKQIFRKRGPVVSRPDMNRKY